jgi:leader peptidase (prepilin peptidase) / N-methyltransferase
VRYVVVELAVGGLWAYTVWQAAEDSFEHFLWMPYPAIPLVAVALKLLFFWMLVALAALDAEHLWLPDWLTLTGIALGFVRTALEIMGTRHIFIMSHSILYAAGVWIASVLAAAALVLLIRWVYWLVRRKEGMGLGDAKLMAMLAAWMGLPGALLAFFIGVVMAGVVAVGMLAIPGLQNRETWGTHKLPLGTFLCVGGIVSSLWGEKIMDAYLRWAGL